MNDIATSVDNQALVGEAAAALRAAVLSGAFFGHQHASAAKSVADFPTLASGEALTAWFGREGSLRLATDLHGFQGALDRDVAALDTMIGEQLDAILHHPRVQRLEGSWRGLSWLTGGIEPNRKIKVKVLGLAWPELCRDLERSVEFDQSQLFTKIYESEFGSPGGEPYGLLVIDHEVRHRPMPDAPSDDVAALTQLAGVAAAAFVPTVLSASPALLQVENFSDLAMVTDLADPFRGPEFVRWRGLSAREDMRFIAVTLPRVLARPPWEDDPARADGFRYAEYAPTAASRVWMSTGYAFAAVVARAFDNHAWPADVRGAATDYVGGGLVTDLAIEPFRTDPNRVWVPLSMLPFGEEAVFSAARSLQGPASYIGPNAAAADANARLSAQLNSMLCVSRFAHYVKVIGRDMTGSFQTAEDIESRLQTWLTSYVNSNISGGPESRARFPLVAARINVRERPGRPGVYGATIHLQPHFQLDNVSAGFRLVTDIAAAGAQA
jgi:predicted component of type VI protein secretion system